MRKWVTAADRATSRRVLSGSNESTNGADYGSQGPLYQNRAPPLPPPGRIMSMSNIARVWGPESHSYFIVTNGRRKVALARPSSPFAKWNVIAYSEDEGSV